MRDKNRKRDIVIRQRFHIDRVLCLQHRFERFQRHIRRERIDFNTAGTASDATHKDCVIQTLKHRVDNRITVWLQNQDPVDPVDLFLMQELLRYSYQTVIGLTTSANQPCRSHRCSLRRRRRRRRRRLTCCWHTGYARRRIAPSIGCEKMRAGLGFVGRHWCRTSCNCWSLFLDQLALQLVHQLFTLHIVVGRNVGRSAGAGAGVGTGA